MTFARAIEIQNCVAVDFARSADGYFSDMK